MALIPYQRALKDSKCLVFSMAKVHLKQLPLNKQVVNNTDLKMSGINPEKKPLVSVTKRIQ